MKKKLASVLYNMNYELATYSKSCANQLVESPALTLIIGVAKHAVLCFEHALFASNNTVSVVSVHG